MAKKNKSKTKSNKFFAVFIQGLFVSLAALLGLGAVTFTGFAIYEANAYVPIAYSFLFLGLILEFKRNVPSWKDVIGVVGFSCAFSFAIFLSDEGTIEEHIKVWPFFFCGAFTLFALNKLRDKPMSKLTEGITLLQSVAIIYWILDSGIWSFGSAMNIITLTLFFPIFVLYHAFSYKPLSERSKVVLSFWSSVIMMAFAIENIYLVYQSGLIEEAANFWDQAYIAAQYFLLGISSMYIVENFLLVLSCTPGLRIFCLYARVDYKEMRALGRKRHIERYSEEQTPKLHAFLGIVFTSTIFWLNHHYDLVPTNFIIWAAFAVFPIFLYFYQRLTHKNEHS